MAFSNIELRNFRCFDFLSLDLSSRSSLFYGKNGCGKTSILESIYVASSGRSFRSTNLGSLIKEGSKSFQIKAFDDETGAILEVNKAKSEAIKIKINNSHVTISELSRSFPAFSIDSKTFFYNENSPEYRRKHIDRGLFIASQEYAADWFGYFRALKQRNAALKQGDLAHATAYNLSLIKHGKNITDLRENLLSEVKKIYFWLIEQIENYNNRAKIFSCLDIYLKLGYSKEIGLSNSIERAESTDLRRKTTTVGPHKADIIFESKGSLIKDIFSRGEQKMISIIWSLAQNIYLKRNFNMKPILLLDDISSELDLEMLDCLIHMMEYIENRFIFSNIDDLFDSKIDLDEPLFKKFHVEQLV